MNLRRIFDGKDSKGDHNAKVLLRQYVNPNATEEKLEAFIQGLKDRIPNLRNAGLNQYIAGVVRWGVVDGEIDLMSEDDCMRVNTMLRALASSPAVDMVDRHFNDVDNPKMHYSFADIVSMLGVRVDADRSGSAADDLTGHGYEVINITDQSQLKPYAKYIQEWCVTYDPQAFENYTYHGVNHFFLCLRDDYKTVEPEVGDTHPFDSYGCSVMAVIIDKSQAISSITNRWNKPGDIPDEELEDILGDAFDDLYRAEYYPKGS